MNIPEKNPTCQNQSAHQKRYTRSNIITMTVYVLTVFASIWYLKHFGQSLHWSIQSLIALVPVVPVAYFCKAYIVFLNESDELMRRIELEAIGLSTVVVGLLFLSMGFLARAQVITLDGITVAVWVFPLLCLFYGASKIIASRRYR